MSGLNIYLSGPMTGYPELNYPQFDLVTKQLRDKGHTVFNPAEYGRMNQPFDLRSAFAEYCRYITTEADTIVMLPGWVWSEGAMLEHALATICGLKTWMWDDGSGRAN